ncbi:MAG: hypothetical protein RDU13_10225 [Elusimicrobiales bacterium]|jgi:hypothetical protein|nr:hypothetical protein [Elusimicrobiales bacterium]
MNTEGTLRAVEDCGLPPELKNYLGRFIRMEADSSLRRALKADPARVLKNMEALLSSASAALGLPAGKAISVTGFDYNNFTRDRLEAALAELRAVDLLALEGFSDMKVLPAGASRSADIEASLGGEVFAFEVRCVKSLPPEAAGEFLKELYLKKIRQARISVKKKDARRAGVFIVVDPVGVAGTVSAGELRALAGRVYGALGGPAGEHVCLVSGGTAAFHPPFR